jgi:DNA-binding MarR family transcriptional regulator
MENYLNQPTYKAAVIQSQGFRALSNFMTDFLVVYGLSLSEWKLLGSLTENKNVNPSAISTLMGIRASITSRLLRSLEEKDLISRQSGKKDSRTKYVSITPKGRKTVGKIEKSLRLKMKVFLSDIEIGDLSVYVKVLDQIAKKL